MTAQPDWKAVGERIKSSCDRLGFSLNRELSKAIGPDDDGVPVPVETISRWKHGRPISSSNLVRLAQALDVSQDWLMWGDAGPPKRNEDDGRELAARDYLESRGYVVVKRVHAGTSGIHEVSAPKPYRQRKKTSVK